MTPPSRMERNQKMRSALRLFSRIVSASLTASLLTVSVVNAARRPAFSWVDSTRLSRFTATSMVAGHDDSLLRVRTCSIQCPGEAYDVEVDSTRQTVVISYRAPGQDKKELTFAVGNYESGHMHWGLETKRFTAWSTPWGRAINVRDGDSLVAIATDLRAPLYRIPVKGGADIDRGVWTELKDLSNTSAAPITSYMRPKPAADTLQTNLARRSNANLGTPADGAHHDSTQTLVCHDLKTNAIKWSRPVRVGYSTEWNAFDPADTARTTLYLTGEGVESVNLDTGDGWYVSRPTTHTNTGLTIFKNIAAIMAGAMAGYSGYGFYPSNTTHHLSAPPAFMGDQLFYAAKDEVLCCEKRSGKILWSSKLTEAPGVMHLLPGTSTVALCGFGFKLVDDKVKMGGTPVMAVFSADSGVLLASWNPPDAAPIIEAIRRADGFLVLTHTALYRLGPTL
jgi:hypothetical protein